MSIAVLAITKISDILKTKNKMSLGQQKYKNEIEVCARAIIINKEGKILVCRHRDRQKNYYFLPGGHIEFNEKAKTALKRELKEELNLEVKKCVFTGIVENFFTEEQQKHHEINLVFEVEADNITDKSQEDHIDFYFLNKRLLSKNGPPGRPTASPSAMAQKQTGIF